MDDDEITVWSAGAVLAGVVLGLSLALLATWVHHHVHIMIGTR